MPRSSRLLSLLCMLIILSSVPVTRVGAQSGSAAGFIQQLDQEAPGLLRAYHVPGTALAMIEQGTVTWAQGYGVADVAAGTPVTGDTVFQAASISKAVTAWGVMRLVEQGKLALDTPAEQYLTRWRLPPSTFDAQGVTIRRLLSHTAGLSTGASTGYNGFPLGERLPTLEESLVGNTRPRGGVRIVSVPGARFNYSGANYLVLQLVIEEVSGLSFSAYMRQEVLAPLGMTRSSYTWTPPMQAVTTCVYDAWGRQLPSYVFTEQAVGGLYTTAQDLGRWVAAHMPGPEGEPAGRGVLAPATIREMLTPQPATSGAYFGAAWGLGSAVHSEAGRTTLAQHSGDNIGYKTWVVFQPETGTGFVVLTNSDRGMNFMAELTRRWLDWRGVGSMGIWRLYQQIDLGLKSAGGMLACLALLFGWRVLAHLRSGRRQRGWGLLRMPGKVARMLCLVVLPLVVVLGWWVYMYQLPLVGGFAIKYPWSAALPLSLHYITASLLVWSLVLIATAFCPKTQRESARLPSLTPALQ